MKIIDVSQYQGKVKWEKVAPQIDFAILRASVGEKLDTQYKTNAMALEALGKPYHAYHYIKATNTETIMKEANAFYLATQGTHPLFYVIDAESANIKSVDARWIVEEFENQLRGMMAEDIRVAIYIGHHLYQKWNLDYGRYAYVWIPRYGKNTGEPDKEPVFDCDLWQYTSKGRIDGISGNVDMSQIHGDKPIEFFTSVEKNEEIKEVTEPREQFEENETDDEGSGFVPLWVKIVLPLWAMTWPFIWEYLIKPIIDALK